MILVYGLALYWGFCAIIYIYDASHPRPQIVRARRALARAQARQLKQVRASARTRELALASASSDTEEPSWLYSHDAVLRFLSPSVLADFQSAPHRPRRLQASRQYHLTSPSEARAITLSTERSEVPTVGEP